MDSHVSEYYSVYSEETSHGRFHQVLALHEEPMADWSEVSKLSPQLKRGWFELAQLSVQDRIDFTRDFWLAKLPYHPNLPEFLTAFFATLDDIGVFLTQQSYEDPFIPHLVYSLANNRGFYHGETQSNEGDLIDLQKAFPDYILPADYLAFMQIHNGFAKFNDTGILPSTDMKSRYESFQALFREDEPLSTSKGKPVNPKALIPFYESFGMPFFQCFWGEWYPEQEMGNVYYSVTTKMISSCTVQDDGLENMAFRTFTDWLMFYLEKID
jgi:hypothetical protein